MSIGRLSLSIFALFAIVFLPYPYQLMGIQEDIAHQLFDVFLLFWPGVTKHAQIDSDSPAQIALMSLLFFLSLLTALVLRPQLRQQNRAYAFNAFFSTVSVYYLSLHLLKYGFDKVFKAQFYLPEPNTLYTPVGYCDKDLLFWSAMGSAYGYNLFLGLSEIIPALLLLHQRTRVPGLLWALSVLVQVFAINLGFDITVKVFSGFLLFLTLLELAPYTKNILMFFTDTGPARLHQSRLETFLFAFPGLKTGLKTLIVGLMLLESLWPYLKSGHFNDDAVERPPFHGAYQVLAAKTTEDSLVGHASPVKRFFIHRHGYILFQDQDDHMSDYRFDLNPASDRLHLYDLQQRPFSLAFHHAVQDSLFQLEYWQQGRVHWLYAKKLDWRELPLLREK